MMTWQLVRGVPHLLPNNSWDGLDGIVPKLPAGSGNVHMNTSFLGLPLKRRTITTISQTLVIGIVFSRYVFLLDDIKHAYSEGFLSLQQLQHDVKLQ